MSKNLASWYFVTAYLFTEPEVKHVSEGLHWELLSTTRVQQSRFTFFSNNVNVRRLIWLLLWQLPEKREDIKDSVQSPCRTELFWNWNRGLLLGCYCCRLPEGPTFDFQTVEMLWGFYRLYKSPKHILDQFITCHVWGSCQGSLGCDPFHQKSLQRGQQENQTLECLIYQCEYSN